MTHKPVAVGDKVRYTGYRCQVGLGLSIGNIYTVSEITLQKVHNTCSPKNCGPLKNERFKNKIYQSIMLENSLGNQLPQDYCATQFDIVGRSRYIATERGKSTQLRLPTNKELIQMISK